MNKFIKQAFTLIELLVVIAIIGILSGLIVVAMGGVTTKANIAKAQIFSNSLRNSLMMNLVSEWKFDQINIPLTNQTPDSWGSNNGTISGATLVSNCVHNSCLSFSRSGVVNMGNDATLFPGSTVTMEAWFNMSTYNVGNYMSIIAKFNSMTTQPGYALFISRDNVIAFEVTDVGESTRYAAFTVTDPLSINTWYHIVVTYDGTTLKPYLNGEAKPTTNWTYGFGNNTYTFYVGYFWAGRFSGLIDDVRIYNAAIPTSQIKEQYYSGLNSLLSNGGITSMEYAERIGEIAKQ